MGGGNTLKTTLLLAVLTGLFVVIGRGLGGNSGMVFAFGLALVMNFGAYWFSDKVALAMTGAKEVDESQAPELHRLVERLALQARMPKPRVYVMETAAPNAFATGRDQNHAAVAVTTGIMQMLDRDELAGVMAHELSHIRNRDTLISAIAASVAGAITMLAHMAQWAMIFGGMRGDDEEGEGIGGMVGGLLMIILAPIAAAIIQMAISRTREYGADATGARILGDPLPLARALEKMAYANQRVPMQVNPSTAHAFTVQPLSGGGMMGLFSTHPPIEERVRRLREMALRPTSYQDYTQL
jgi:heat shock protein HtpX